MAGEMELMNAIKELGLQIEENHRELKADMQELRTDMGGFKGELRAEMKEFKQELRTDMRALRTDMKEFKQDIKSEMEGFKQQVAEDMAEDRQILRALEYSAELNRATQDVMQNDIAHIKGDLEGIKRKIVAIEAVTADNWREITALKLAK